MKNRIIVLIVSTMLSILCTKKSDAQITGLNNNTLFGAFVGFNGAQDLEFRTNDITRMQLMQTGSSLINTYTVNTSGNLGLSADPTFFTTGLETPFSLLHLNGDNFLGSPQQSGFRGWMRYGIVSTHNQDLMFIGQKRNSDDVTDAVIAWADNGAGPSGPDNLTFVYTAGDGSGSGALSDDGLECARMTAEGRTGIGTLWTNTFQPKRRLDVIGNDTLPQFRITHQRSTSSILGKYADFEVSPEGHLHVLPYNSLADDSVNRNMALGFLSPFDSPTEKLDVMGTARLRVMPDSIPPNVVITGVEQNAEGDYQLNYLSFSGNGGEALGGDGTWVDISASGCEWNEVTNGTNDDLVMGYAGACNEGRTGIGVDNPDAKLSVLRTETTEDNVATTIRAIGGEDVTGLVVQANAVGAPWSPFVYGVNTRTVGDDTFGDVYGSNNIAQRGKNVTGVYGNASLGITQNVGAAGVAIGTIGIRRIGVYGEGATAAGYFTSTIVYGSPLTFSDAQFKSDINDIDTGLDVIMELKPRQYTFNQEEYSYMNLPSGQHFGFIAQELENVLPDAVEEVSKPEIKDPETGDVVSPALDHLAVNYQEIIPILVKATQEQQATIEQLQSDLADLQAQVAACCEAKSANGQGMGQSDFNLEVLPTPSDLKQNYPNPFAQQTTIQYTIGCACKAEIVVYDQSGRMIATLVSGAAKPGTYSVNWDASNLESGIYFYTLIVDGQEFVKRAVKI